MPVRHRSAIYPQSAIVAGLVTALLASPPPASALVSVTVSSRSSFALTSSSALILNLVLSLVIGFSLIAIALTLAYLGAQGREPFPFHWIFYALVPFIILMGVTRFLDVMTLRAPESFLYLWTKIVTAIATAATAIVLPPLVPRILRTLASSLSESAHAHQLKDQADLLDLAGDAIFVHRLDHTIQFWNRGAEKTYGWTRNEALGQCKYTLLHTEFPEPIADIDAKAQRDGHWEGEVVHTTKAGDRIVVFSRWFLQRDNQQKPKAYLEISADITHRKTAEEDLRRLNKDLERRTDELVASNKELEAFTYSVSHDLRAPLRHIQGFAGILMEEETGALTDTGKHYLERIRDGAKNMSTLVDELLTLARLGRQAVQWQIVGLRALVEEARKSLAPESQGRDIEWKINDLPFVECDPALMKQVLLNLLSNAVKYTRPVEKAVIEIGMSPTSSGEDPIMYVRDNGVGFNMKYADKLFGVFQRLHRTEDFEGTGIGLATAQRIVHKHGGKIWADAELGRGATFQFTLGRRPEETPAVRGEELAIGNHAD